MKEKDFEVIVPAYDALEAELEDILGGTGDCYGINVCGAQGGGSKCAEAGEYTTTQNGCCPGLWAVRISAQKYICAKELN